MVALFWSVRFVIKEFMSKVLNFNYMLCFFWMVIIKQYFMGHIGISDVNPFYWDISLRKYIVFGLHIYRPIPKGYQIINGLLIWTSKRWINKAVCVFKQLHYLHWYEQNNIF